VFKRLCTLAALAALTAVLAAAPGRAAEGGSKEALVKAAFLYNFVKFVEWPNGLAVSKQQRINICIIGSDPINDAARQVFARASTSELTFAVSEKKNTEGCHVAFISHSEEGRLSDLLGALKDKPVLTVSDIDDFARRGGMIGFVTEDNKIKLVVNTSATNAAGLRVDAQLLEIALKVIRN